jgi:hypothetical protein
MPRILCNYLDCIFLEERYCSAASVEIDPDSGCLTYKQTSGLAIEDWEDDDDLDEDEWDEIDFDEEEDLWLDDEDEI